MAILALFAFTFLILLAWAGFVIWHLHTYVLKDDLTHARMLKVFLVGSGIFIVLGLIFFAIVDWRGLSPDLFFELVDEELPSLPALLR